jgi:hypothetical protein
VVRVPRRSEDQGAALHHWQHWLLREDDGDTFPLPMPETLVREIGVIVVEMELRSAIASSTRQRLSSREVVNDGTGTPVPRASRAGRGTLIQRGACGDSPHTITAVWLTGAFRCASCGRSWEQPHHELHSDGDFEVCPHCLHAAPATRGANFSGTGLLGMTGYPSGAGAAPPPKGG